MSGSLNLGRAAILNRPFKSANKNPRRSFYMQTGFTRLLITASLCGCLSQAISLPLFAEQILVPVGQQTGSTQSLPHKGASQSSVLAQYGEPSKRTGPVGTPPITTWDYNGFSVYFEHQHVIHAVVKHTPKTSAPPAAVAPEPEPQTDTAAESEAPAE
jgi:hypothetical protein